MTNVNNAKNFRDADGNWHRAELSQSERLGVEQQARADHVRVMREAYADALEIAEKRHEDAVELAKCFFNARSCHIAAYIDVALDNRVAELRQTTKEQED